MSAMCCSVLELASPFDMCLTRRYEGGVGPPTKANSVTAARRSAWLGGTTPSPMQATRSSSRWRDSSPSRRTLPGTEVALRAAARHDFLHSPERDVSTPASHKRVRDVVRLLVGLPPGISDVYPLRRVARRQLQALGLGLLASAWL